MRSHVDIWMCESIFFSDGTLSYEGICAPVATGRVEDGGWG